MGETGGMLDTYLLAQALGWEWNLSTMIILSIVPILIIGGIVFFVLFVVPVIVDRLG